VVREECLGIEFGETEGDRLFGSGRIAQGPRYSPGLSMGIESFVVRCARVLSERVMSVISQSLHALTTPPRLINRLKGRLR